MPVVLAMPAEIIALSERPTQSVMTLDRSCDSAWTRLVISCPAEGETATFGRGKARSSPAPAVSPLLREDSRVRRRMTPGPDYPYWNFELAEAWLRFADGKWLIEFRRVQAEEDAYVAALKAPPKEIPEQWPIGATRQPTPRDLKVWREGWDRRYLDRIAPRKHRLVSEATASLFRRLAAGELVAFGIVAPPSPGKAPERIPSWWWAKHELNPDWRDSTISLGGIVLFDVRVYFAAELDLYAKAEAERQAAAEAERQAAADAASDASELWRDASLPLKSRVPDLYERRFAEITDLSQYGAKTKLVRKMAKLLDAKEDSVRRMFDAYLADRPKP